MVVCGIDPGVTTGVAVYLVPSPEEPVVLLETQQWGNYEQVTALMLGIKRKYVNREAANGSCVFVIEQFDKRPGIVDPDFTPKFIINDIERYLPDEVTVYQTPSQAKNLVKPAKNGVPDGLKRFGWYVVGMNHANDASRHVITFLVERLRHMPTIIKGWPPPWQLVN